MNPHFLIWELTKFSAQALAQPSTRYLGISYLNGRTADEMVFYGDA